jgi:hypothetical protein
MTGPSRNPSALRELERERLWLERAELHAGRSGFAEHATTRLAAGERMYGNRWARLGLMRLVAELSEEAADLGAWSVLALQALDRAELPPGSRECAAARLHAAILCGAHAHHALSGASRELRAR